MSLRPRQRQLGDARALTRRHRRDERGRPVQPVAFGLLQRRHGDWDRRTPWSRLQHPAQELQAPTTKSTACGSTNPSLDFTAARAPCVDTGFSVPATRVTRHQCTNPAPTVSRRQDDKVVIFKCPLRCQQANVPLPMMAHSSSWLGRVIQRQTDGRDAASRQRNLLTAVHSCNRRRDGQTQATVRASVTSSAVAADEPVEKARQLVHPSCQYDLPHPPPRDQ